MADPWVTDAALTALLAGSPELPNDWTAKRCPADSYAATLWRVALHSDDPSYPGATTGTDLIATAFLVILAVRRRTRHTLWLTLTALILLGSVLVTTIVFNLPINAEQSNWAVQAPPADWASVRDRWQIAHAVRTSAAVLAFGCLSTAAMGTSAINLLDHSRTDRRSPATWDSVLHQGGRA